MKSKKTTNTSYIRIFLVSTVLFLAVGALYLHPFWEGAPYLFDGRLTPLIGDNEDFEIEANGFLYAGSTTNLVDRHIYYFGMWEVWRHPIQFFSISGQILGNTPCSWPNMRRRCMP